MPEGLKGEAIDRAVRLVQLAADAQAARRLFGTDETVALVRTARRPRLRSEAGRGLLRVARQDMFAALEVTSVHDALVEAEPGEPLRLSGDALDAAIATIGQYADMKSRFTRGHSAGVAALAGRAAERQGLAEATAVRRAGHLHDIGRAGVVLDIWDKPGPADRERAGARAHAQLLHRADPDAPRFARPGRRRSRRWRTSGSTAAATTGGCPRRAFRRARASSPPPTRTTR